MGPKAGTGKEEMETAGGGGRRRGSLEYLGMVSGFAAVHRI